MSEKRVTLDRINTEHTDDEGGTIFFEIRNDDSFKYRVWWTPYQLVRLTTLNPGECLSLTDGRGRKWNIHRTMKQFTFKCVANCGDDYFFVANPRRTQLLVSFLSRAESLRSQPSREDRLAARLATALEYIENNPNITTAKGASLGNFVESTKQLLEVK